MTRREGYVPRNLKLETPRFMSRGLLWFITIIASIFFAVGALFYIARGSDGPLEIIAGGPFQSGKTVTGTENWRFLDEEMTVELQTMNPPSSRTMWLVVTNNRVFIISSYMNSRIGKLWKKWPHLVAEDNRALVRSKGLIYPFVLERRLEDPAMPAVLQRFNEKYRTDLTTENVTSNNTWVFELLPDQAGSGS